MKNIIIVFGIIILLVSIFMLIGSGQDNNSTDKRVDNIVMEGGKQIIEVNVRGGYSPMESVASSSIPTVIRFKTNKTFDCSSSVIIPSLKINEYLENTGVKDIDIGIPEKGTLRGSCGMGMYKFQIEFK